MEMLKSFRSELIQQLIRRGYKVSEISSLKNNGVKDGIVFHNKSSFSPVLYLEPFYKEYKKGRTIDVLADKIEKKLQGASEEEKKLQKLPVLEKLHHYQEMKGQLRICMVNQAGNQELLAEVFHKRYGDFAALVYWVLSEDGNCRMLFTQDVMTKVQMDFDTVFKDAYINMMGEFELKNMEEMLYELMAEQLRREEMKEIPTDKYIRQMCQGKELYAVTHKSGLFGAAALCYERELERIADRLQGDFVMIPASIHELLFLPFRKDIPLEAVNELVRQINAQWVKREDCLSDMAYVYLAEEKGFLSSQEYMKKTQQQIEQTGENHQRSEYLAREEWRDG